MNYAEDRLDRRARTAAACYAANSNALDDSDCPAAEKQSTSTELERDLAQAQSIIHRYASCTPTVHILGDGIYPEEKESAMQKLIEAHRLAGRTLRDGGSNSQSVFHFGMAWKLCYHLNRITSALINEMPNEGHEHSNLDVADNHKCQEWEAVGDYAQMAEFAGFPEVGVIALLFYRAGSFACHLDNFMSQTIDTDTNDDCGCGCGLAECGRSPCYIAFPASSRHVDGILQYFDQIHQACRPSNKIKHPSALDILNQLALLSGKSSGNTSQDRLMKMQQYMSTTMSVEVPTLLRFWNQNLCNENEKHSIQPMHSVLILLLLKLLYSSPIGGPFLLLACQAVPYLAAVLPVSSVEGRHLAKHYKSHWAYFVFIRALVLGERTKKKPGGGSEEIHTPVWDVLLGTDSSQPIRKTSENALFSLYIQDLLAKLSDSTSRSHVHMPQVETHSLPHPPVYVLGDSHVLSLAWQSIYLHSSENCCMYRTFVPYPSTGIKAWHFRNSTQFFTHYNLNASLQRLLQNSTQRYKPKTVMISAGEIDCREGIGGSLLHGYYKDCNDAIENTVLQYLKSVSSTAREYNLQVLLMPVAPHAYRSEKNGKALGRAKRRETMHVWNEVLRRELQLCPESLSRYPHVFLLDYEKKLRIDDPQSPVGYVLKPSFNADYTHVNSTVVKLIMKSLSECGCNLSLL
ncbi:hypothetical protein ACHAXN_009313 [Cyclotella atomus]